MARIAFLVDGFNLYHALDHLSGAADHERYHRYKWLSLTKLANCFITKKDRIVAIEYFTTLATWNHEKVARHKLFIRAQESEGVLVVYGEFKRKDRRCPLCKQRFSTFEEKQTDVNIALRMFQLAVQDKYDKVVIVSGDTDLIPAVRAVQATFPSKEVGVVIPIGRASEDLKRQANFYYRMKEHHLASSRFPDTLKLSDGSALNCPEDWR